MNILLLDFFQWFFIGFVKESSDGFESRLEQKVLVFRAFPATSNARVLHYSKNNVCRALDSLTFLMLNTLQSKNPYEVIKTEKFQIKSYYIFLGSKWQHLKSVKPFQSDDNRLKLFVMRWLSWCRCRWWRWRFSSLSRPVKEKKNRRSLQAFPHNQLLCYQRVDSEKYQEIT